MSAHQTRNQRRVIMLALIAGMVIILLVVAYVLSDTGDNQTDEQIPVTLFLGFVPNVQFAPAYVAAENGYFADEGIAIRFENGNENDGLERIATNDLKFGLVSGEQVVLARAQGRPVVYVFEWYHNFPVGIVARTDRGISEPADLAGQVVGIPGPYGASYIGLRAILTAGDLTEDDLAELRSIGYTAAENICEDQVDAAVVYVVNEPLKIERQCSEVTVINVSDYATLVSNGLVTNEQTINDNPDLVRGIVRALQRGLADVLADPDAAFDMVVPEYVPDLAEEEYETQRQVLYASLDLWRSDTLGLTNPAAWEETQAILLQAGFLDAPLDDLSAAYDMSYLPDQD